VPVSRAVPLSGKDVIHTSGGCSLQKRRVGPNWARQGPGVDGVGTRLHQGHEAGEEAGAVRVLPKMARRSSPRIIT
jgi:hypothetical protein